MTYQSYRWFAYSEQDLLHGRAGDCSIGVGDRINIPTQARFELQVSDDDDKLSGDKCDEATDGDQNAFVNGHAIRGKDMYAERIFTLLGSNGEHYQLVEIEIEDYNAPGKGDDFFSFVGAVPPADALLKVVGVQNVTGDGISYADLMSTPTMDPKNSAPELTNVPEDGVIKVDENTTAVIDIDATDADDDTVSFTIVPGADSAAFEIDHDTGALSFVRPPDFENPTDVFRGDNTYDVTVRADDGKGGVTEKTLWVKVQDVDEGGTPDCIVIEAETMQLSGFNIRHASNVSDGGLVRLSHTGDSGEISTTFAGEAGQYDLSLFVQDESDGQSSIRIKVNGQVLTETSLDADTDGRGNDNGVFSEIVFPQIELAPGDTVSIEASGDGYEFVRIDKIELCRDGDLCPDGFTLIDFEGFDAGTVVNDQFAGVTITAQRDRNNTDENDAMLFDSDNPTGGDTDLAFEGQGNLLIISEDNDSDDPDDAVGGTITFAFDNPSDLHDIKVFDIEGPRSNITLTFANGEIRVIDIPAAGDNSAQTIALNAAGVTQMDINLASSGAVDDLCWAPGVPNLGSLGGVVFMDANANAVDDGEMGVAGVPVTLLDADGAEVATTTTADDGSYLFDDLDAGDYRVVFPTETADGKVLVGQDVGGDDSVDSDADPATGVTALIPVGVGEAVRDIDAGVADPGTASLGGVFFADADKNDVQGAGDTGVAGATVQLVLGGVVVATTTTAADGSYLFEDLDAGEYSVIFTNPGDQVFVTPDQGGDDTTDSDAVDNGDGTATTAPVTVNIGDAIRNVDAGIADPDTGAITGVLFVDTDKSDTQSDGDTPVAGVTVTLLQGGVVVATTTTGPDGSYTFDDLAQSDDYSVRFDNPTGLDFAGQDAGGDDAVDSDVDATGTTGLISVVAGETTADVDAGLVDPGTASLGGRLFVDSDDDDQDNGNGDETGIAGQTVTLQDADGNVVATQETGPDGSYLFTDLDAGTYVVVFPTDVDGQVLVAQDVGGDVSDSDADPATGATGPIAVNIGDAIRDVDAGVEDPGTASLGGIVFMDANANAVDDGEMGVAGVPVTLLDADGAEVATTTTADDGSYLFDDLDAGDYRVVFPTETADGKVLVGQDVGGDDSVDSDADPATGVTALIPVGVGEAVRDIDAGVADPGTASLGGVFFVDANKDDVQGAGDTGVPGATVQLVLGGVVVATTTTAADGSYLFEDLDAGEYSVIFINPSDQVFVTPDQGGDDTTDSDAVDNGDGTATTAPVTVNIGDAIRNVDAGTADPGTASLGDTVFIDENGNGSFDAGEATLADIGVTLLDEDDIVIATTTTAADGTYLFDDLDAGTYSVLFEEADGFDFTTANTGNDAADSDADATTGQTGDIVLGIGETDLTVDAGFLAENATPVATNDTAMVCALKTTTIDVLANDTDADNDIVTLATVNGVVLAAGESTTLESGAVVTLNQAGALEYDSTNAVLDGVAAADILIGTTLNDSFTYTISDGRDGTDDAVVTVEVKGALNTVETIAETLPMAAATTQGNFRAGLGYSSTINGTGDSRLDGLSIESAYCIEREEDFIADIEVSMDLHAGTESAVDGDVFTNNLVENLDAINWLLNQNFTETSNGDVSGPSAGRNYTEAEIQHAIWGLTDGNSQMNIPVFVSDFYNGTQENVDELLALALQEGDGFEAGEGDLMTIILDPTEVQAGATEDTDYDQAFIVTVLFDDLMQDCVC